MDSKVNQISQNDYLKQSSLDQLESQLEYTFEQKLKQLEDQTQSDLGRIRENISVLETLENHMQTHREEVEQMVQDSQYTLSDEIDTVKNHVDENIEELKAIKNQVFEVTATQTDLASKSS